jgi:hypothetical protein
MSADAATHQSEGTVCVDVPAQAEAEEVCIPSADVDAFLGKHAMHDATALHHRSVHTTTHKRVPTTWEGVLVQGVPAEAPGEEPHSAWAHEGAPHNRPTATTTRGGDRVEVMKRWSINRGVL